MVADITRILSVIAVQTFALNGVSKRSLSIQ